MSNGECLIGFSGEAYDSAADAMRRIIGWTVEVFPDGWNATSTEAVIAGLPEPFDATVVKVEPSDDDGQWKVHLRRINEDGTQMREEPNDGENGAVLPLVVLDIFDDLDKVVVY